MSENNKHQCMAFGTSCLLCNQQPQVVERDGQFVLEFETELCPVRLAIPDVLIKEEPGDRSPGPLHP